MYKINCELKKRMIKIESPEWIYSHMGGDDIISGVKYFEEEYTTPERAMELLELAQKEYKEKYRHSWKKEPKLQEYTIPVDCKIKATFTLPDGEVVEYESGDK